MAQQEVPSSSSITSYDVFLSFRGIDTRYGFTGHLYNSLCQKGIQTFIDDQELRRGEEITPALLNAIQNSRIAIIIFSKNYASSSFCLKELVQIVECLKEEQGRSIFPVFYDVDPSQVRHQTGTYSEALEKHRERFEDWKVQEWEKALTQAADLSGWDYKHGSEPEYKFIQKIVEAVSQEINRLPLHVAEYPIGLENAMQEFRFLLRHGSDVNMIGIYGVGGIGKTTIARAVYNSIFKHFEGTCFLSDIREKAINKRGLVQLQEMLLSEILKEKDIRVGDVNRGIPVIKRRLRQKKVLLVLDDVDELEQLQALAGKYDWFGCGSVIIFTTRNKHLLATHGVKILYEVNPLNNKRALKLFNWHAFKSAKSDPSFVNISKRAVSYACGLPLALEVIGSHLFGKSLNECNSALNMYGESPHTKIQEILKVSYDGLEENEQRIFLDIACFLLNCKVYCVTSVLHVRGFHAENGLRVLVDRSLIKTDASGFVRMHDLIRDMGREIVRQEATLDPGKRSRLWFDKDILHVMEKNMGTDKIEFISLQPYKNTQVQWNREAFRETRNLSVLYIENTIFDTGPECLPNSLRILVWRNYPSSSLPFNFNPKQLEILFMPQSCLQIFQPQKMLGSLIIISFKDCRFLTNLLNLREVPSLFYLCLDGCTNLVKIDDSIGFLRKLSRLSAKGCTKLKILAPRMMLPSLEILDLEGCSSLESFPEVLGKMEKLREIYLDKTAIEKLPVSIGNFVGLELFSLSECPKLSLLPHSICTLWSAIVIFGQGYTRCQFFGGWFGSELPPKVLLVCHVPEFLGFDINFYLEPGNVPQNRHTSPLMTFDASLYLFAQFLYESQDNFSPSLRHYCRRIGGNGHIQSGNRYNPECKNIMSSKSSVDICRMLEFLRDERTAGLSFYHPPLDYHRVSLRLEEFLRVSGINIIQLFSDSDQE